MTAKTHIAGGVTAGLLYIAASSQSSFELTPPGALTACGYMALSVVGSLAPDIDLATSKLGHKTGLISKVIDALFGHRTVCHSPLLLAVIYFLMSRTWPDALPYVLSFIIGATSHLVLDLLNHAGIPLLWPIPKRFRLLGIKSRGPGEIIVFAMLCGAVVITGGWLWTLLRSGGLV